MKKRRLVSLLLTAALIIPSSIELSVSEVRASDTSSHKPVSDGNKMRMWYTKPGNSAGTGTQTWETTGLVLGNGKTGAILFGQVDKEQIHFNEKTLWSGGPGSVAKHDYVGGNRLSDQKVTTETLNALRNKADDHSTQIFPLDINDHKSVVGDNEGLGKYEDFGDIYLDFSSSGVKYENVENYVRDLDLSTAISGTAYDFEGTHYEREYFASHPDGVVVVHLKADQKSKLSFKVTTTLVNGAFLGGLQPGDVIAEDGKITAKGTIKNNGMRAEMQVKVVNKGGNIQSKDKAVEVTDADEVTIVYSTETNYKNQYPTYLSNENIDKKLSKRVNAAAELSYEELKENHLKDYKGLFDRVSVDLGGSCPEKPTDQMMADYRNGTTSVGMEELAFQFGRYLTIASSREGDQLPSNLNGIWMKGIAWAYFNADFHFNINIEMNYWPAYQTNLAECGSVFTDYLESLVVPGRITAERSAATPTKDPVGTPIGEGNGFNVHTANNPFGFTAPQQDQSYGWNITGASWALQNAFEEYEYTKDDKLLKNTIYPMIKETVNFWDSFLWESQYQTYIDANGVEQNRLVVSPSFSPEQGPTASGTTYDQSLVWEVYNMAIKASKVLNVDVDKQAQWEMKKEQLNPIYVGSEGQIKEWYEETKIGYAQAGALPESPIPKFGAGSINAGSPHRHISNLVGLYPGTLISKNNTEWAEAAEKTLIHRNELGTGWSRAHKINLWARLGNSEKMHSQLVSMMAANENGLRDNLLDSHPPFQIDGNFGLTSGVSEALLQSQEGYTEFLPALPDAWNKGDVKGLVSRGNFVIDMKWDGDESPEFTVHSNSGGTFEGVYDGLENYTVFDGNGTIIEKVSENNKISFETTEGQKYLIKKTNEVPITSIALDQEEVSVKATESANLIPQFLPENTNADKSLVWISEDSNVATVDNSGKVTGIKEGTTVIKATTINGLSASCKINVLAKEIDSIKFNKTKLNLERGNIERLELTILPEDTTIDKTITWSSDDESIASVDQEGLVTGKSKGSTTITATTSNGLSIQATVNVYLQKLFDDVNDADWYYDYVEYVKDNNIMTGLNENIFGSGEKLSRAHFAVMIYRLEGSPKVEYSNKFKDIKAGEWFTDAIIWAENNKIVTGYENGYYGPQDSINREEMATIMYRYANYKGYDTNIKGNVEAYPDYQNVTLFAKEAISWAIGTEMIRGDYGKINPLGDANRAQGATVFTRYMKYYEE